MKSKFAFMIALAVMCGAAVTPVSAKRPIVNKGVGILTGASVNPLELPQAAQEFIKLHFGGKKVAYVDKEFLAGTYEVQFADGVEAEFDTSGLCTEITASANGVLDKKLVKSVLPKEAYKTIAAQQLDNRVEEIAINPYTGYNVEFVNATVDDMNFNTAGILTYVDYND